MVFSSIIFLWIFLPLVLAIYFISDRKYKNYILLASSIIFYTWGEPSYIIWMLLSVLINYIFGILIEDIKSNSKRKIILVLGVISNLSLLGYFKYLNFLAETFNSIVGKEALTIMEIALPIGISFYTFQAMSYVIDVYRSKKNNEELKAQRNILNLALYISFFPQLVAGPIVKYYDVEKQIYHRKETVTRAAYGIKRFILGLSKKILISNVMAATADNIFGIYVRELGTPVLWLGIICYTLQIYYDFSGYSDMAIGLGQIFGFSFMENFNYPYISQSITEFWRRWHISLSTWFKEYLYIPLGGNRKGKFRTYINLLIVFFATGFWHGASYSFIFWGLFHGFFMIIERLFLGKLLEKNKFKFLNNLYTLGVVVVGWVFFRVEEFRHALSYVKRLFINSQGNVINNIEFFLNKEVIFTIIIGIIFAGFAQKLFPKLREVLYRRDKISFHEVLILGTLFFLCIMKAVAGSYNPFIYFKF